ncbi:glutamate-rich protein 5 [Meriones unguiculatus]|uniref:glutamate-rich protein 5 n=1 Tax=Meriones unguiculatus TaxID=10047 RepID=UPI00293F727B|nr:glutamate-rich protein 5 [Meriones unguiculatus]
MGCSSSALNKAGESNRFGSAVPSNENSSAAEQSKFCVAQPKPCTPGREAAFYGNAQRESHPPPERPKASVVPTANGVKSYHQQPLPNDEAPGKDAIDELELTKKTEPLVQGEECELLQAEGKDITLGDEEMKEDMEARTESQSVKGNAETEFLGTEALRQPLKTSAETDSGAGEGREIPQTGMTKLETAENILPLETAKELPSKEAMGNDAQSRILGAIPKENNSPETAEGHQFVEKAEQKELQETLRKDKQFQLLETIPKENNFAEIVEGSQTAESSRKQKSQETPGKTEQPQILETVLKQNETPQIPDRSQLVQTPVMNKSPCGPLDGIGNAGKSQPGATGGSKEQLVGTAETAANVEMARETHTDKEEQHIEGETGEKVEAEMKNEKESEEAETEEKETGEAVDLGAAGDSKKRASVHSVIAGQENLRL